MTEYTDPQRLLDDPSVAGSLRGDLAAAAGNAPLAYELGIGLARFHAAALALAPATASGSQAGTSLLTGKVVVGIAGLMVVGGVAWALLSGGRSTPPVAALTPSLIVDEGQDLEDRSEPAPSEPQAALPEPQLELEPSLAQELAPAADPLEGGDSAAAAEAEAPGRKAKKGADSSAGDYLAEARKVQRAQKALDADPAQTLRLLAEIEREFPNGQLTEERQGLRVLALLATGSVEDGQRRAQAYLLRHPKGTLASRVRRALAERP